MGGGARDRAGQQRGHWTPRALLGVFLPGAALLLAISVARAQDELPAPPVLTFGVEAGIEASDNPGFDPEPDGGAIWTTGRLSFGYLDETPLSRLSLTGDVGLRAGLAGDDDSEGAQDGIETPTRNLRVAYARQGATADFEISARLNESRIDVLRPLSDFIDDDGVFTPPDSLDDLTGEGWRRTLGFDTNLTLGRGGPVETTLSAGANRVSYRETDDPDLDDSERRYADIDLGLALSPVTQLELGLRYSTYEDDDQSDETWTIRSGLTLDRPDGALRFRLQADDGPDGTRVSANAGRFVERPWGSLDASLGATRTSDGETFLGGGLRLIYDLPQGQLRATLDRSVVSGKDDAETLRTTLTVGYTQDLTRRAALSLDLAYAANEDLAANQTDSRADFGLGYNYVLTPDWRLNLGYTYRVSDEDGGPRTDENAVRLTLRRDFAIGF